jgi:hypothetical protein
VTVSTVISAGQPDISVSSSWAKLQISPDTLVSMAYGNFRVDIYEHANNQKSTTLKMKTGKVKSRFCHIYKIRDGLEVEI